VLDLETRERAASPERGRIVEALIEIAAERGYAETTIEMILERAGLDRPAFDRHFRGKYDCFLSTWQEINESCMREMVEAFNSQDEWPDRLRAVACEIVDSLRNDPARASFAVEVLAAGDAARARRDMTMRVIASLIDAGRNEMDDPESVPHTTAARPPTHVGRGAALSRYRGGPRGALAGLRPAHAISSGRGQKILLPEIG
jgi:AcrR family transcriptional regulator